MALWTTRLRQTAEATRKLGSVSAASASERGIIERLGAMAEQAGVRIDEMRPQEIALNEASPPGALQSVAQPAIASQTGKKPADIRRGVRLVMSGNFEDIARFFQSLDVPTQFAAVRSLRIVAEGSPGASAVVAEANIELFCPSVPDAGPSSAGPQQSQSARTATVGTAVSGAEK